MSNIILILGVIIMLLIAYIAFDYVKFIKNYYEQPEDKTGLYDFISINDNIINVDHIINIKQVQSVQDKNYKIIIELDDNKEPIIFDFDDDYNECTDIFIQLSDKLDAADII